MKRLDFTLRPASTRRSCDAQDRPRTTGRAPPVQPTHECGTVAGLPSAPAAIISDGRDSDAWDLGAAGMRAKRREVLRRLPWWHQNRNTASTAGMPSPRARNEMRSGRGRGRCFRASLEANATTKPRSPARSPMPSVVRRGRTRRLSTAVRSSSTEVQSTCTLPEQETDRQRESETLRDVFSGSGFDATFGLVWIKRY